MQLYMLSVLEKQQAIALIKHVQFILVGFQAMVGFYSGINQFGCLDSYRTHAAGTSHIGHIA
jgi:hypothetical protein